MVAVAECDDDLVAWLYEIGGRHRTERSLEGRPVYASELAEPVDGEPVLNATARAVYRARVGARRLRRGGGLS